MRVLEVIMGAAIAGAALGAALAYVEVRPDEGMPSTRIAKSDQSPIDELPRVEVDSPVYQFGTMQRGTTESHEFVFKNAGQGPLTLKVGSTSCKCTIGEVTGTPIPPGGSVNVKLEWSALVSTGPFRQTATIETNDPRKSLVELSVEGEVVEASGILPPDFVFDRIDAGGSKIAEVFVMAFAQDDLQVEDPQLTNTETRDFFDISIEPVEPSELPDRKAKSGVRVRLTAKPGLRLGNFDQWLSLKTNIPEVETIKIPVFGRVAGNISIHGRFWNEDQGVLRLGRVKSSEGATASLNVVIRGAEAENTKLSIASVDPPELKATLGEPKRVKDSLVHMPLLIEIPPGTPSMARLDIDQHDEARVVLKTNQPDEPEMVLGVRFAVER